jgi:hypothetical protein
MARPISKTTKFILALPKDLTAKQVLAKAKASGLETSESNVHRVRRLHGRRTKTSAKASLPATPAPKGGNKPSGLRKSDFVREQPASTPAKEVVAKAKASGLKLDLQYVYKVRSRSKPRRAARAARATRTASAPTSTARTPGSSTEALLRALGAELGLARAVAILESERARVSSITRHMG